MNRRLLVSYCGVYRNASSAVHVMTYFWKNITRKAANYAGYRINWVTHENEHAPMSVRWSNNTTTCRDEFVSKLAYCKVPSRLYEYTTCWACERCLITRREPLAKLMLEKRVVNHHCSPTLFMLRCSNHCARINSNNNTNNKLMFSLVVPTP